MVPYKSYKQPHTKHMNSKNRSTLEALFERPVRSDIRWKDVEMLFRACVSEGRGSRVRIELNNMKITLHKPHPHKEISKFSVVGLNKFLNSLEIYHYDL